MSQDRVTNYLKEVVEYRRLNPTHRHGQALFNSLYKCHGDLANEIRGTDIDPYYAVDQDNINRFYSWLVIKLQEDGNEHNEVEG